MTLPKSDSTEAAPAIASVAEKPLTRYAVQPVSMTVNGRPVGPIRVPEQLMLIDFLHEYLGLTGSRLGCGQGVCHACVVILDNADGSSEEVRSCITGASFFDGKKIRTVEAHPTCDESGKPVALSPVQQKFLEHFSFQCGYCTPGFVNATTVLIERLKRQPIERSKVEETITEALNAHICRCTGYVRYYEAVKDLVLNTAGLVRNV
ncbi:MULTISPECIES: (2Fe-2S)-binding protein [Paraburkholderia]|uniref:Aerobic-type carbon monoxide dehydrogenase small subunit (CoxS/CutS family) n=1 Tax=Paraburkholderia graminis TaxID=60548 RepID=A0ABD5CHN9_9BURK|nr:2Fe-2S iron-sulfur cluster-binding protein [Paraburkholderia graminis]MDR6204060.1 aerobic-type carbon monoxide dehydrogenase small subunit (CoxS/CutS family) [Paraburkholderia graminis]